MLPVNRDGESLAPRGFPCWLLALPALVAAGVILMSRACQPFWLGGSSDPSYPYLANSLLLAEGRTPTMTQHPGTGLQLLGVLVLRVVHAASRSPDPLRLHVLRDPELFLSAFQGVLAGLNAAASTFVGWAAWRLTGQRSCAVAAQAGPLAAAAFAHSAILVMCEPLLTALGATLCGLLLLVLLRSGGPERHAHSLGAIAGLGVATKLTAAPLVLLPLAFLETRPARLRFVATTVVVLALILLAVLPQLPWVLAWFADLAAHPGLYAQGPTTTLLGDSPTAALRRVIVRDWLLVALTGALACVALLTRQRGDHDPQASRERRGLAVLVLLEALGLLAAARQGGLRQYAVPLAPPIGLGLVLAYRILARRGQRRWPGLALWVVVLLVAANQIWRAESLLARRADVVPGARAARTRAARIGLDRLLLSDRASDPVAALSYANDWAGGAFGEDLRTLYPDRVLYNETRLHSFGRPIEAGELSRYVAGDGSYRFWASAFVPLQGCRWFVDPRQSPGRQLGRDVLVRVAAEPPVAAGKGLPLPPFVGFLALEGLGRYRLPDLPPQGALWGAGPTTRLAFMGAGGSAWLLLDYELATDEEQTLTVRLNGGMLLRRLRRGSGSRVRERVPLDALTGPNELAIDYSRLFPPPARDGSRPPADPLLRPTGVLFRSLQITRSPP